MHLQNLKISKVLVLLIMIVFVNKIGIRIDNVINDDRTCLSAYDGFGYYMYLPHFLQKGNLDMTREWATEQQLRDCGNVPVYQLEHYKKEESMIDIYHMGLSYIQLPPFIMGDIAARTLGYERNGFSKPYHITYLLNALVFIFIGLIYFRKILRIYLNEVQTALLLFLTYLGTNLYVTFAHQYDLTHLYLFTLNGIWFFHMLKFRSSNSKKSLMISVIIFGLTVAIRPTQAMFGIIPFFILYQKTGLTKSFWKKILLYPLAAFIFNIPQFIYWKIYGGSWFIPNLHTEDLVLTDPSIYQFLFSFRKGWLIYTPFFLLLIGGFFFLYKKDKKLSQLLTGFTLLYIYIMASWECWWYASSYSQRVMTDVYPIITIPIALLIRDSSKGIKIFVIGFALVTTSLSIFQSYQFEKGIFHTSNMTWDHYKYIFGKTKIDNYHTRHLRIEQGNTEWLEEYTKHPNQEYRIDSKELYHLDKPLTFKPDEDKTIGRISIYESVPTDETLLELTITTKSADSTKSVLLKMETVSKYNCYGWDSFEVSTNAASNQYTTHHFKFNIPAMRHKKDEIQMYLFTPSPVEVEIKDFKIKSHSIVR